MREKHESKVLLFHYHSELKSVRNDPLLWDAQNAIRRSLILGSELEIDLNSCEGKLLKFQIPYLSRKVLLFCLHMYVLINI
jgi:hypothetical protein